MELVPVGNSPLANSPIPRRAEEAVADLTDRGQQHGRDRVRGLHQAQAAAHP